MITTENYLKIMFEDNKHHLDNLLTIISQKHVDYNQPGFLEGNCMYDNCTLNINPLFYNKQINIFNLASNSDNILEIGVNAGHSLLIMLLANPSSMIHAFDICTHPYTEPCVRYLNNQFNDRITLIKGDSKITLPEFIKNNSQLKFDLLHVDGMHEPDTDHDFRNCYQLAKNENSIMMWDDSDNRILSMLWKNYIDEGKIEDISNRYLPTYVHQHAIGIIKK